MGVGVGEGALGDGSGEQAASKPLKVSTDKKRRFGKHVNLIVSSRYVLALGRL